MIPKNINRSDIIKAIEEVNKKGIPERRQSTRYQILFKGISYPPKYVISLSNRYSNGFELPPWEFSGGTESNQFLKSLGFEIIDKSKEKEIQPKKGRGGNQLILGAWHHPVFDEQIFLTKLGKLC